MRGKIIFRLTCLLLLMAVVITYLNHFHNSFHFDDAHTIQNNIFIQDIKNIPRFFTDATTFSSNPSNQSYRPVVSTTLAVDYWLGNGDSFFFHLRNFIGLLIYAALTYLFVIKIFNAAENDADHKYLALFVAALFALHPLVAETVNYIISRSDIISSAGVMAGMVIWLYFPAKRKYGIYLLPVVFGMLAKPTAAMFAPILFFTDWLLSKDELKNHSVLHQLTASFRKAFPAIIVCGTVYEFIHFMTPKTWIPGGTSLWNYLITQPYVMLLYLRNTLLPTHLSADTDLSPFTSPGAPAVVLGFAFLACILAVLFLNMKNKNQVPVALGLFWFLAALLPTSVVPLAEVMNDHRMFFPLPGLLMAVVWMIHLYFGNILRRTGKLSPS